MKKLVVFDLDGTLAESKSSLDTEMSTLLRDLLSVVKVALISGGSWQQFETQLLSNLLHDERLKDLTLLPTCGTKFFRYEGTWQELYSEDFTTEEKQKIIGSLTNAINLAGIKPEKVWECEFRMSFVGTTTFQKSRSKQKQRNDRRPFAGGRAGTTHTTLSRHLLGMDYGGGKLT